MTRPPHHAPAGPPGDPGWSFEANRRRQLRRGLALTPAQRLRWLEEMVPGLRRLLGKARHTRERGQTD